MGVVQGAAVMLGSWLRSSRSHTSSTPACITFTQPVRLVPASKGLPACQDSACLSEQLCVGLYGCAHSMSIASREPALHDEAAQRPRLVNIGICCAIRTTL